MLIGDYWHSGKTQREATNWTAREVDGHNQVNWQPRKDWSFELNDWQCKALRRTSLWVVLEQKNQSSAEQPNWGSRPSFRWVRCPCLIKSDSVIRGCQTLWWLCWFFWERETKKASWIEVLTTPELQVTSHRPNLVAYKTRWITYQLDPVDQ